MKRRKALSCTADKGYLSLNSFIQVAMCDREKNPGCRLAPMFDLTDTGLANLDFAGLKIVLVRHTDRSQSRASWPCLSGSVKGVLETHVNSML